jgi:hypothetical protein
MLQSNKYGYVVASPTLVTCGATLLLDTPPISLQLPPCIPFFFPEISTSKSGKNTPCCCRCRRAGAFLRSPRSFRVTVTRPTRVTKPQVLNHRTPRLTQLTHLGRWPRRRQSPSSGVRCLAERHCCCRPRCS